MAQWQLCEIEFESYEGRQGNTFSSHVAYTITPQDTTVIDKTPELNSNDMENEQIHNRLQDDRDRLVGRLLEQGWEPFWANPSGDVALFKRPKPTA